MKALTKAASAVRGWAENGLGDNRGPIAAALTQGFDWAYAKAVDGMPGLEGAEELAASYARRYATADEAVAGLIAWQSGVASVAGFVTGCGGFVALPVALPANLASALYIQVRLIAAIAHLRGHDIRSSEARALVLACLTGSKAANTLKDAGVRLGTRVTRDALSWISPVLFKKVERAANIGALNTVAGVGAKGAAKLGRFVPVVGGIVAGGFDAAVTQLIGRTADRVFTQKPPPADGQVNDAGRLSAA